MGLQTVGHDSATEQQSGGGGGAKYCISSKLPGDTDTDGLTTTL